MRNDHQRIKALVDIMAYLTNKSRKTVQNQFSLMKLIIHNPEHFKIYLDKFYKKKKPWKTIKKPTVKIAKKSETKQSIEMKPQNLSVNYATKKISLVTLKHQITAQNAQRDMNSAKTARNRLGKL